jgi:hypothetical protein
VVTRRASPAMTADVVVSKKDIVSMVGQHDQGWMSGQGCRIPRQPEPRTKDVAGCILALMGRSLWEAVVSFMSVRERVRHGQEVSCECRRRR